MTIVHLLQAAVLFVAAGVGIGAALAGCVTALTRLEPARVPVTYRSDRERTAVR
jgi:hypothetical protein